MAEYRLGEVEMRFANLIWDNEPLTSGGLVKIAEAELSWKKSTTYTILKRLCDREIFRNDCGIVTSLVSKTELEATMSMKFLDDNFDGSLAKFLTALGSKKELTEAEIKEIKAFLKSY